MYAFIVIVIHLVVIDPDGVLEHQLDLMLKVAYGVFNIE